MATQAEYNLLLAQYAQVKEENEKLKEEQLNFMNAVEAEIIEIENTNSFWKYFKYVKLVVQMIGTIKSFIDKRKRNN